LAIVALPLVLPFSAAPIGHDSPYILPAVLGVSLALPPLFLSSFQAGCSAQVSFVGQHSLAIFCLNPLVIGMLRQSACFSAAPGEASGFTTIVLIFGIAGSCLIMASLLKRMGLKSLVA
jgi:surface polysaccharide O-acyltransferase-like enzyme